MTARTTPETIGFVPPVKSTRTSYSGLSNLEKTSLDLIKESSRDSALLGMSNDFDCVSYVDLITDEETVYYSSQTFKELLGKQ
ncbi:hypothetical protein, partial [uncultured Methanobrevibacter sp.]|uniref:hypothetical protein n=1 Tax=uncultured Methanobrevibacter sp. TaxID=253161 RepID=UPI0026158069